MKFNTPYDRVKSPGEINSGEIMTQAAGYISRERQIKSMIDAGKRLEDLRKMGAFDTTEQNPEIGLMQFDVTREKSFFLEDASRILNDLQDRIDAMQNVVEEKIDEIESVEKVVEKITTDEITNESTKEIKEKGPKGQKIS